MVITGGEKTAEEMGGVSDLHAVSISPKCVQIYIAK